MELQKFAPLARLVCLEADRLTGRAGERADGEIEMPRIRPSDIFHPRLLLLLVLNSAPLLQIDERLRQLKSDTNEIDHGSHDDVAAAKGDGKNGLLGHWGEQQEWRELGPKKQRKIKYGEGEAGRKLGLSTFLANFVNIVANRILVPFFSSVRITCDLKSH